MKILNGLSLILFCFYAISFVKGSQVQNYCCGGSDYSQNATHHYRISVWHNTQEIHFSTIAVKTGHQYQTFYDRNNISNVVQINDIPRTYELLTEICKQKSVRILNDGSWNFTYHINLGSVNLQIYKVIQLHLKNSTDLNKLQTIIEILNEQNDYFKTRAQEFKIFKIYSFFIIIAVSFFITYAIALCQKRINKLKLSNFKNEQIKQINKESSSMDSKLNLKTKDAYYFTVIDDTITKNKGDGIFHHLTIQLNIIEKQLFKMQIVILNSQKHNIKFGFVTQRNRNQYADCKQSIYYDLSNLSQLPTPSNTFDVQNSCVHQEDTSQNYIKRKEKNYQKIQIQVQLNRRKNLVSWFINQRKQIHVEIPDHLRQTKLYPSLALKNVNDKIQLVRFWKLESCQL